MNQQRRSFLTSPFMLAFWWPVPALIFAEADCIPRLGKIVNHFAETGLVVGPDTARFQAAVSFDAPPARFD
jgi:hypothetical protein